MTGSPNPAIVPARAHRPRRDGGVNSKPNGRSIDRTRSGTMARALVIEEESGTCSGFAHPHNGYYAGDFHRAEATPVVAPVLTPVFLRATDDATVGASPFQMV